MHKIDKQTFRNPNVYIEDRGLSKKDQDTPTTVKEVDSSWLKASLIEGRRSGTIVDASTFQSFAPYQTEYESKKRNNWGITKQTDKENPWVDYTEDTWYDSVNYPADFRGIQDIEGWYAGRLETTKELYQWKTDVFGNQYGLYKNLGTPTFPLSLYTKKHAPGDLWICTSAGKVQLGQIALSAIFNNHTIQPRDASAFTNLTAGNIIDFDIFYDTLMLVTPVAVTLDKILFDYTTGQISSFPDYTHTIDLSADKMGKFGDAWFFEENKKVIITSMVQSDPVILPYIYELDIEQDSFSLQFPLPTSDLSKLHAIDQLNFTSFDYPTFSYNPMTGNYNISVMATNINGESLVVINLNKRLNQFKIDEIIIYAPVDLSTA